MHKYTNSTCYKKTSKWNVFHIFILIYSTWCFSNLQALSLFVESSIMPQDSELNYVKKFEIINCYCIYQPQCFPFRDSSKQDYLLRSKYLSWVYSTAGTKGYIIKECRFRKFCCFSDRNIAVCDRNWVTDVGRCILAWNMKASWLSPSITYH